MTSPHAFVAVIVPVYQDGGRLEGCLEALEAQSWPHDRYEVIVVDNGGDDLSSRVAPFARASCVREERPGSFAARNRGAAASRGSVLAFTDVDCLPDRDWIQAGVEALEAQGGGQIAGEVEFFVEDSGRVTAWDLHDLAWGTPQKELVAIQCAATANTFVTREAFEAVGGFDGRMFSCGDREFSIRLVEAGYPLGYSEKARLRHPTRSTLREFVRRRLRIAGGQRMLMQIVNERNPDHGYSFPITTAYLFRRIFKQPPKDFVRRGWNRVRFMGADAVLWIVTQFEWTRLRLGGAARRS